MPGQAAQKRAAKEKAEKATKMQQVAAALAWCAETKKGSKAALATGNFPSLTQGILDYALKWGGSMTRRWVVASTSALQISCLWAVALATIIHTNFDPTS